MKVGNRISFIKTIVIIGLMVFVLIKIIAFGLFYQQKKMTSNPLEKHKQIILGYIEKDSLNYEKLKHSKYLNLLQNASTIDSFNIYLNNFHEESK